MIWGDTCISTSLAWPLYIRNVFVECITCCCTLPCRGTHTVEGFPSNNEPYDISADLILVAFKQLLYTNCDRPNLLHGF